MLEADRETALSGRVSREGYITISEADTRAMIDLRLAPDDEDGRARIGEALGFALPTTPRTSALHGDVFALWLSIDQWLIVGPDGERSRLVTALEAASRDRHASVVDLSEARTIIRLEGRGARETVMKGGAADLLDSEFVPGSVRRLTFAGIPAMVHHVGMAPEQFDLYVFRSYADYAFRWLEAASSKGSRPDLFVPGAPPDI